MFRFSVERLHLGDSLSSKLVELVGREWHVHCPLFPQVRCCRNALVALFFCLSSAYQVAALAGADGSSGYARERRERPSRDPERDARDVYSSIDPQTSRPADPLEFLDFLGRRLSYFWILAPRIRISRFIFQLFSSCSVFSLSLCLFFFFSSSPSSLFFSYAITMVAPREVRSWRSFKEAD